jgi:hypothetical protein
MLITNTFNIVMAVFDVAQYVVNSSAGLISGSTAVDAATLETIRESLEAMALGALLAGAISSALLKKAFGLFLIVLAYFTLSQRKNA